MLRCCTNPLEERLGKRAESLFVSQIEARRRHAHSRLRQKIRSGEWLSGEDDDIKSIDKTQIRSLQRSQDQAPGQRGQNKIRKECKRAKFRRDFLSWGEFRESEVPDEDVFAELIRATARSRPFDWFQKIRSGSMQNYGT